MRNMAQYFITQKLKQLTVKDIVSYSQKYEIPLTRQEAIQIVKALKTNNENPFDPEGRKRMLKKLAAITSKDTARSVNKLLMKMAKEYGVEDWMK